MRRSSISRPVCYVSLITGVVAATGLQSADAADSTSETARVIEEIVVTAEKREAALSDVPLSIQAFDGGELYSQGHRDIKSVLGLIPNASLTGETSQGTRAYQFRGVATGDTTGDATVGSYIDEFAFSIPGVPFAAPADLYDVARVEILKGPQGTVYGSNAMAGLVKIVTNDPELNDFDFSAAASFGYLKDHGTDTTTDRMVNLPVLEDKVALRGVFSRKQLSGWAEVPALGIRDGNDNTTSVGRLKLLVQPTERLSVIASYWDYQEDQDFTNRMDGADPAIIADVGVGRSPTDYELYTASINYDFDFASLTVAGGHIDRVNKLGALGEQVDTFFDAQITTKTDSTMTEARLVSSGAGALSWIVGAFYQDGGSAADTFFNLTGKGNNPDILIDGTSDLESEEWAGYGEVSYDLWEGKVRPLIGLRYTSIDRTLGQDSVTTISGDPPIVLPSTADVDGSESKVVPRFNLSYRPQENRLFYLNVAEGFRPGALQTGANVASLEAVTGVETPIQQEIDTLLSYEVGTKVALLNNDLNVAASVYVIDWKDAQFQTGLSGITGIINLGNVEGEGIELQISHRTPVEGLTWAFSGAWNDTKIKDINPTVVAGLPHLQNGEQVPNVPENNAVLQVDYVRPGGFYGSDLLLHARYEYRDSMTDLSTGLESGVMQFLSLNAGFETDNYRVLLFADNLTNEEEPSIWEQGRMIIPRPRTLGIRLMFTPEF